LTTQTVEQTGRGQRTARHKSLDRYTWSENCSQDDTRRELLELPEPPSVSQSNRQKRFRDHAEQILPLESSMIATPRELLDTSIAQLQTLTAFLGDQLCASAYLSESSATPEIRACEEILVSLGALILKVKTVRRVRSRGFGSEHL
jgi:hypothetical protein